jgi:predicted Fe-Mo cluster-binding NifX family protein
MQIAVTSQNRRTITEHAGKCRKFWIYEVEKGQVNSRQLLELPLEQSFHASGASLEIHPLDSINVLITASMGAGLQQRLLQNGIKGIITLESDPDRAVHAFLNGRLEQLPPDRSHEHHHGHQH